VYRHRSDSTEFTVLLVCTGNICRSALAERLGQAYLDEALGADAALIRVTSAGTQGVPDSPMHPDTATVLQGFGAAAGDFRSRPLVDAHAIDADLILAMTRAHRRDVLQRAPRALARTFTLREAAHLVELTGDATVTAGDLPTRARELVKLWAGARSRRQSSPQDDVLDPFGQPLEVHQQVGDVIVASLLPVLGRIAALGSDGAGEPERSGVAA
jgi:protein-tyrosine phosphatase